MSNSRHAGDDPVVRTLEHELGLVREAVALVASGGSTHVVLAGLQLGDQLLEEARRIALGTGVRIVPVWTTDESGVGISVERPADD